MTGSRRTKLTDSDRPAASARVSVRASATARPPISADRPRKSRRRDIVIGGERIRRGQWRDLALKVSETAMGVPVSVPIRVVRAARDGPALFVTGAVHGDELNGTGIIRELMVSDLSLECGTIIFVPVVNVFGFDRHSRYLPDRRDLNRSFPGRPDGNLALRLASVLIEQVVAQCDYGVDLHTAAIGRTNFPHVRADLSLPGMRELAEAFGCEVIVDVPGDKRSLRSTACRRGCKALLLEAGEALKIEPGAVAIGVRGIENLLRYLGMQRGDVSRPLYQTTVRKTVWVRSQVGGLLRFHVAPGDLVDESAPIATCDGFFRPESPTIDAPTSGIVLGMTTLPVVRPGGPVCHLGVPDTPLSHIRRQIAAKRETLYHEIQQQMAGDIHVVDYDDSDEAWLTDSGSDPAPDAADRD